MAQTTELALGLEMSGQRFLWVVRSPTVCEDVSEAYFIMQSKANPFAFLSEGFADRTREVGLLVMSWVPQVALLNHVAIGGFLSHCGWNSMLETVKAKVSIIAWLLFVEQRQNAAMLAKGATICLHLFFHKERIVALMSTTLIYSLLKRQRIPTESTVEINGPFVTCPVTPSRYQPHPPPKNDSSSDRREDRQLTHSAPSSIYDLLPSPPFCYCESKSMALVN
ncbi:UDP-glycosyltransferase 72B1-like [Canna indica]|uniref:UDP-glycosyltransferase 72B1-like n=1 Tax=Canna indica TaxID=4628 RepID=A0AAQ3QAZ0_9LILI|nr:UDP-glycosyltransferase 72B1-like [Canna indica]